MTDIIKVLSDLGVDFSKKEYQCYLLQSMGCDDLIVETWNIDEWLHITLARYSIQQSNLVADPEIQFRTINIPDYYGNPRKLIQPIYFRQETLGIYQEAMIFGQQGQILASPKVQRIINEFLKRWAKNIKNQGYKLTSKYNDLRSFRA